MAKKEAAVVVGHGGKQCGGGSGGAAAEVQWQLRWWLQWQLGHGDGRTAATAQAGNDG